MKTQQQEWLKAAVIGSIWASFEIVFGSFFHSLRLPFAGTFLSFFSIVLLITFSYKWQGKYLFLKAGLVAALMRSLLPTSVILGPLIGIMLEAIIFQFAINFFKRNYLSYSIAGILVMFSAIIHKIVSVVLIYGLDIVAVLERLYFMMLKVTRIELPVNELLLVVIIGYVFFGMLASYLGMRMGISMEKSKGETFSIDEPWEVKNTLFDVKNFKYKTHYLFIHLLAIFAVLFTLELYAVQYVLPLIIMYLAFLVKRYGKSMRRLAKPLFWVQLLIIVGLAVLLWDDKVAGAIVGIKMILRAIIIVSALAAISVELKNPLVKSLLYKKGYSQLYATMGLATSSVPFILKNLAVEKKSYFNPSKVLKKAVNLAEVLYHEFEKHLIHNNVIYIISGETRSGKTTYLKELLKTIKEQKSNIKIKGIIAHGIDKEGERYGFDIENVETNEKQFLCSQEPIKDSQKIGRFYFSKKGLSFGEKALTAIQDTDLLVIDEIGYLELKGKGWFESIEKAMENPNLNMIWVVRKRILEEVLQQWQHSNTKVISISTTNINKIAKNIIYTSSK